MTVIITKTNRTRVLLLTCMYPRAGFTDIDKLISIKYKVYNRTDDSSWYTVLKTNELTRAAEGMRDWSDHLRVTSTTSDQNFANIRL